MTARKKIPEIELPPRIAGEILSYIGPKTLNELDSNQMNAIADAANECAKIVSAVLRGGYRASREKTDG